MEQFTFSKYTKFIVIGLLLVLLYISYKIIAPFLAALLGAGVVAIAIYPMYKKLKKKTKRKNLSAIIVIIFIIIFIIIPLIFFANKLFNETIEVYNQASELDLSEFSNNLKNVTGLNIDFERQIKGGLQAISKIFISSSANVIEYLAKGMLNLFIFFFTLFFLLRDGKKAVKKLRNLFPIKEEIEIKLFSEINKLIRGLISGVLIIAIIEGIIALIGFYLFGIPSPLLWSFVIVLAAYLPIIGPATVYVPAAIYLAVIGNITEGVLLLIYSFGLITYLDNIVKPNVMGKGSNINPAIVLLGVLGGLNLFGIPGIVVGPLILSILFIVYRLYEEENAAKNKKS